MNGVFHTDFEYLYISIYLGELFVERAVLCCAVLPVRRRHCWD